MRVLVMTRLFPNRLEPLWAPYNRQQFGALGRRAEVEVLSTVPWFPGAGLFPTSMAGRLVGVPDEDTIEGLHVRHPRYVRLPKWGHGVAGALYAASLMPLLLRERHRYDVILAAWAYPDAVAAVILGKALDLPVAVKLHGSDLNVLAETPSIGMNLRWAFPRADRVLAVSRPLAEKAIALGARPERTTLLKDGVDTELFYLRDRTDERKQLGLPTDGKLALFVGNLYKEKGAGDIVDAFEQLAPRRPDLTLCIAGQGPLKASLDERAARIGPQLKILGPRPHAEVAKLLGAADVLTLPSWNEGTPSVLLEALASGRPVVMTPVGGIPDVVDRPVFGELVPVRDPVALAAALDRVTSTPHDAAEIAKQSGLKDWAVSAADLEHELALAIETHRSRS